jgi:hypothetical protein
MNTARTIPIDMRSVLRLAAAAECDPRTAERALREGPHVIRTRVVRDRLTAALAAEEPRPAA